MGDPCVVGLDVGGTHARAVLATVGGRVLGTGRAGGGNPTVVGAATAIANIVAALRAALGDLPGGRVEACVVGLAGVSTLMADRTAARTLDQAWADAGLTCPVHVVSDVTVSFAAGTPHADGTLLVSGTGAVAARMRDRLPARFRDGYGWLLGDDGSGFWIGRQAARATLAAADGRAPMAELAKAVLEALLDHDADSSPTTGRTGSATHGRTWPEVGIGGKGMTARVTGSRDTGTPRAETTGISSGESIATVGAGAASSTIPRPGSAAVSSSGPASSTGSASATAPDPGAASSTSARPTSATVSSSASNADSATASASNSGPASSADSASATAPSPGAASSASPRPASATVSDSRSAVGSSSSSDSTPVSRAGSDHDSNSPSTLGKESNPSSAVRPAVIAPTTLAATIGEGFTLRGRRRAAELVRAVAAQPTVALARLAPLVMAAYELGDPVAVRIVDEAAVLLVESLAGVGPVAGEPVVLGGSVLVSRSPVFEAVAAAVGRRWPETPIGLARDGAAGATWLAAREVLGGTAAGRIHGAFAGDDGSSAKFS